MSRSPPPDDSSPPGSPPAPPGSPPPARAFRTRTVRAWPGTSCKVCVIPHLGLGDMFALNGLVRHVCSDFEDVLMFVKKAYANASRNLYGDIANLRLLFVDEYQDLYADNMRRLAEVAGRGYALLPLGFHAEMLRAPGADWKSRDPVWARALYRQLNLDPARMFSDFGAVRSTLEDKVAETFQELAGTTYVVLHDDPARGFVIDRSRLPEGVPVLHVDDPRVRTDNVFDYAAAIDAAIEFHGIDSSFMWMAALMCPRVRKVCHAYAKPGGVVPPGLFGETRRGRSRVHVLA